MQTVNFMKSNTDPEKADNKRLVEQSTVIKDTGLCNIPQHRESSQHVTTIIFYSKSY